MAKFFLFVHEGRRGERNQYHYLRASIVECWLCSFVISKGIQTSIAKKPFFVIFIGGPDPLPPPLHPRMFVGYGQLNSTTNYLICSISSQGVFFRSDSNFC